MKIKCEYCDFLFDDAQEYCPHCGAPNAGVVREKGKSSKPTTIEELQDLYIRWNLPPYETTRFFIGQDYRGKRAFGIYRDETTGNVVVYKNKDNGQRAVRYEGTDEAFAVNEIYQRLKQEIVNQKGRNAAKRSTNSGGSSSGQYSQSAYNSVSAASRAKDLSEHYAQQQRMAAYRREQEAEKNAKRSPLSRLWHWEPDFFLLAWLWKLMKFSLISIGATMALLVVAVIWLWFADEPTSGYYLYEGQPYYYYINENHATDCGWFTYDDGGERWIEEELPKHLIPYALEKDSRASEYFESKEWTASLGVADFSQTLYYQDRIHNFEVDPGYYQREDTTYYHIGTDPELYWYYFDDDTTDWKQVSNADIPADFKHGSLADDFYYTSEWDPSTQFTDFHDSAAFSTYESEKTTSSKSSGSSGNSDNNSGWTWDNDDDDDTFTWDDDNDWDWGGTDWDADW